MTQETPSWSSEIRRR